MQTALVGTFYIFLTVTIAVVVLLIRKKWLPIPEEDNQAVAGYFSVVGIMYGVLVGFIVFLVWSQFEDAKANLTREANQIGDIFLMTRAFAPPYPERIKSELINYINAVTGDEWESMKRGEESPRVQESLNSLWSIFRTMDATGHAELYDKAVERLNELSDNRRLRLHASRDPIPSVIWALLYFGAIVTVLFSYFFDCRSFVMQCWMTALLAGSIALVLFLITALDQPFSGDIQIDRTAFQIVLDHMKTIR